MYRRILFAVDDDEALRAAVPAVAAFARQGGAEVRVLHVHRTRPARGRDDGALVASVVEQLRSGGVEADGEVRQAGRGQDVADVIAKVALSSGVDLVVMGSHGRTDLAATFLGSVSASAAAALDVPVLVLRSAATPPARPRTVLVAVDGSPASDEAVAEAADLAKAFGARVAVLHVQQVMVAQGVAIVEPDEDAGGIVDRAVGWLKERGVEATGEHEVSARVAQAVADVAERIGADLLVLGSRRPSDVSGLLLGSVAHQVVHLARRPVLLARRIRSTEPAR